jgi:hypothetical protein
VPFFFRDVEAYAANYTNTRIEILCSILPIHCHEVPLVGTVIIDNALFGMKVKCLTATESYEAADGEYYCTRSFDH